MSPRDSDRYLREAVWEERWFPDIETAQSVAESNNGTLVEFSLERSTESDPTTLYVNDEDSPVYPSDDLQRPGTSFISAPRNTSLGNNGKEWLFRSESRNALDLLHRGEIAFLEIYARRVFNPPLSLSSKRDILEHWRKMSPFVASFIDSTIRVDESCTEIRERSTIADPWGPPQALETFLKEVNDSWADAHQEAELIERSLTDDDKEEIANALRQRAEAKAADEIERNTMHYDTVNESPDEPDCNDHEKI